MRKRLTAAAFVCALLCSAAPSLAQDVFITSGTKLLKVGSGATLVLDFFQPLGDLTVGPDNRIYVVVTGSGCIERIQTDGSLRANVVCGQTLHRKSGVRFDSGGNLYFVDSDGNVQRVADATLDPPGPLTTVGNVAAPGSIAFGHNGDLLALVNGTVYRFARNQNGTFNAPPGTLAAAGLTNVAVGLGVASGGENTQINPPHATGQLLVATGNTIRRCPKAGGTCGPWATLGPAANSAQHVELFSDDKLSVVTSVDADAARVTTSSSSGATESNNGRFWQVTGNGSAQEASAQVKQDLKNLTCTETRVSGGGPPRWELSCTPFIGVGVPPTSRSIVKMLQPKPELPGTQFGAVYNFGSHLFDVLSEQACNLTVTSHQVSVPDIRTALGVDAAKYRLLANYLGEEGFGIVYQTAATAACQADFIIAALFDPTFTNPRIMKCNDQPFENCTELPVFGVWSAGPVGEDDPAARGGDEFGTKYFLVDRDLETTGTVFCGFDSPLNSSTPASFNSGQTVAVKFSAKTGNCASGAFDASLNPVISLLRKRDGDGNTVNEIIRVASASGNSNEPPTFRLSQDAAKGKKAGDWKYLFNLNLTGLPDGLYEIGVTDQNSKISFQKVEFRIPKQ